MGSQMKDFQLYITDFRKWESELKGSKNDGCVLVCDIHASWCGPCKAIQPTFQRMFLEYSEEKPIKFLVLDAEKIIGGMKSEGEEEAYGEEGELEDDTRRENWLRVMQPIAGKSQPHFLVYQGGKLKRTVTGVNTPLLSKLVKQLMANEKSDDITEDPSPSSDARPETPKATSATTDSAPHDEKEASTEIVANETPDETEL